MLSFQPEKTQVVLLGTSEFPRDPENLPLLPQVMENVKELHRLLADPETVGIASAQITILLNPATTDEAYEAIANACIKAEDTLLVYYSGHGLVGRNTAELYLATSRTTEALAEFNALSFEQIRRAIANSPALKKILILDCCFSGRVLGFMGSEASLLQANLNLQGTFAIASAPANRSAIAPPNERFTAFTGELIRTLTEGIDNDREVITLEELYESVRVAIRKNPNLPEPCRANFEDVAKLAIAHNHFKAKPPLLAPVIYDAVNRELRTVMAYFSQEGKVLVAVTWEKEIHVGARIEPNMVIARIFWDTGSIDDVKAPAGCEGRIDWLYNDFPAIRKNLSFRSIMLLRVAPHAPVIYDAANGELRTVKAYFAQEGKEIVSIMWEKFDVGARIEPNMVIARIFWDEGTMDEMKAPAGCEGRIDSIAPYFSFQKEELSFASRVLLFVAPVRS